jgi:hypothetical protein
MAANATLALNAALNFLRFLFPTLVFIENS